MDKKFLISVISLLMVIVIVVSLCIQLFLQDFRLTCLGLWVYVVLNGIKLALENKK